MAELEDRDLELASALEEQFKKIKTDRRRDTVISWGHSLGVSLGE